MVSDSLHGLMRACWNGDDFQGANRGQLRFLPEQVALIRERLEPSLEHERGDDPRYQLDEHDRRQRDEQLEKRPSNHRWPSNSSHSGPAGPPLGLQNKLCLRDLAASLSIIFLLHQPVFSPCFALNRSPLRQRSSSAGAGERPSGRNLTNKFEKHALRCKELPHAHEHNSCDRQPIDQGAHARARSVQSLGRLLPRRSHANRQMSLA